MIVTKAMIEKSCQMVKKAVMDQDLDLYKKYLAYQIEIGRLPETFTIPRDEVLLIRLKALAIEMDYTTPEMVEQAKKWLIAHGYEDEIEEAIGCRGE